MSIHRRLAFLNRSIVRYLLTGGIGFAAEILVIWVLAHIVGASSVFAVAVSFWVGLVVSFLLQKLFTFRNAHRTARALSRQTTLFAGLVLVNYLFTLGFVALVDPLWNLPTVTRACALVITTAWNYLAYKYVIFRE